MIQSRIPLSRRTGAFSMLELLLVLAVVSILAALLFPAFARMRDQRAETDLTTSQQIFQTYFLYAADYDNGTAEPGARLRPYLVPSSHLPDQGFLSPGAPQHLRRFGYLNPNLAGGNNLLSWGHGPIMVSASVTAIFWGTQWNTPAFVLDKISGVDAWYQGEGGSKFSQSVNEYKGSNGQVGGALAYSGHYIDLSTAPTTGDNNKQISDEVCRMIGDQVATNGTGYYPVYIDQPVAASSGYLAWHDGAVCNGRTIQYAFFYDMTGIDIAQQVYPKKKAPNHSSQLTTLAYAMGHELSEARSDPQPSSGWSSNQLGENGDACAWAITPNIVTFTNGTQWLLQGNWSNKAYLTGTGYANSNGDKGCYMGPN